MRVRVVRCDGRYFLEEQFMCGWKAIYPSAYIDTTVEFFLKKEDAINFAIKLTSGKLQKQPDIVWDSKENL